MKAIFNIGLVSILNLFLMFLPNDFYVHLIRIIPLYNTHSPHNKSSQLKHIN